jgi:hypothetical protein
MARYLLLLSSNIPIWTGSGRITCNVEWDSFHRPSLQEPVWHKTEIVCCRGQEVWAAILIRHFSCTESRHPLTVKGVKLSAEA